MFHLARFASVFFGSTFNVLENAPQGLPLTEAGFKLLQLATPESTCKSNIVKQFRQNLLKVWFCVVVAPAQRIIPIP
jgi:hypothetical protein